LREIIVNAGLAVVLADNFLKNPGRIEPLPQPAAADAGLSRL
jgi:hypothetical protein